MSDLDGAPITGAETTTMESKSTWSSTSSAETELDNFWHDSSLSNHFYTTQDTTLDTFNFNDDTLFFGPFESCNSLSLNRDQAISHATQSSTAGVDSIDFANPSQLDMSFPQALMPTATDLDTVVTDNGDMDLSWTMMGLQDGLDQPLKDKINNALVRGDGGRLFIPEDALKTILSQQAVHAELIGHFPHLPAKDVQKMATSITTSGQNLRLLRVFGVLLLLDKVDSIVVFLANEELTLPLMDLTNPCLSCWSQTDLEAFERLQWRFFSPVFYDMAKQEDNYVDLEEKMILPYIESWENKKQNHYKGGNSEVWKVKIHDAHHNFESLQTAIPNSPYFAIKRLKSKDEEAFHREVRNLQRLHNADHPNLLSLLATYKYRGSYHLVFPWAESDLRRLWQSTDNPQQPGRDDMRWLANQCASIADALKSVHAGAESWLKTTDDPAGQQRLMNKIGIHGDIKPENIFIFSKGQKAKELAMGPPTTGKGSTTPADRSSRSGSPSSVADDRDLVIGDFGGGDFYDASKHPDPLRQMTVTYRPPEYDTKLKPVSRSWDVWGLGCTYLEFVTWFLLGRAGLKEFAKRRTTRTAAGKLSDEYFDTFVDPSQTGGVGAILKGSVLAWINDLSRHRNASPFIRDFLNFITHRMFIIEDAIINRASGDEVAEHMNSLNEKCRQDDLYCAPSPLATSPWEVESTDSSITTLSSTTPDDFTLDFTTTEDVTGASNTAWNFSMDLNPLQWNTAPVLPANGLTAYNSLNCADVLGTWNYTAPVVWNNESLGQASVSVEKKRKRKVNDDVEGLERRVSPKTSTSPQESGSSTAEESPAEEALRIKKRVPPNTTEEQRWNEVYLVLFPEETGALPSPFYEDEPTETRMPGNSKQSEVSDPWLCSASEYERYLTQSLPPRVQRELEREVQREFGFVGDAAQTRKVVDMVQKLQLRLFRQFESERGASSSSK
ncbi:protein kinase [Diaporthe eres]|nr:protein kinase [Diaporthe eres]